MLFCIVSIFNRVYYFGNWKRKISRVQLSRANEKYISLLSFLHIMCVDFFPPMFWGQLRQVILDKAAGCGGKYADSISGDQSRSKSKYLPFFYKGNVHELCDQG